MLGEKLKLLREKNGLLQRQVAACLEVDTAYISKIESNEKLASRTHLKKLSQLFKINESDLVTLWLADKLYFLAQDEAVAIPAMKLAEKELQNKFKRVS